MLAYLVDFSLFSLNSNTFLMLSSDFLVFSQKRKYRKSNIQYWHNTKKCFRFNTCKSYNKLVFVLEFINFCILRISICCNKVLCNHLNCNINTFYWLALHKFKENYYLFIFVFYCILGGVNYTQNII